MKIRKLIFLINCLVAIFVAQMPQDVAAQEAPNALRLWKDGKVVAQTNTIVDSIVLFYYPAPSPPQTPDPTTVGGIVPTVEQAIDMGLSVKWAPWNVGASKAEEYGAYFAWGEVNASKESYDWGSYYWMAQGKADWMHINKYQIADSINYGKQGDWWGNGQFLGDGIECLESSDDAATANWGSCWRMPTVSEWEELLDENNTDITLIENYNDSGLYVLEVKSKKTDGVLFFSDISEYWTTCTLGVCGTADAYGAVIGMRYVGAPMSRCEGHLIRAVAVPAE